MPGAALAGRKGTCLAVMVVEVAEFEVAIVSIDIVVVTIQGFFLVFPERLKIFALESSESALVRRNSHSIKSLVSV